MKNIKHINKISPKFTRCIKEVIPIQSKTIKVSAINHKRLLRIKGVIQQGTDGSIDFDNVITFLLDKQREDWK